MLGLQRVKTLGYSYYIVGFYSFLVISFVLFDCFVIVCLFVCLSVCLSVSSAFWRINVFVNQP